MMISLKGNTRDVNHAKREHFLISCSKFAPHKHFTVQTRLKSGWTRNRKQKYLCSIKPSQAEKPATYISLAYCFAFSRLMCFEHRPKLTQKETFFSFIISKWMEKYLNCNCDISPRSTALQAKCAKDCSEEKQSSDSNWNAVDNRHTKKGNKTFWPNEFESSHNKVKAACVTAALLLIRKLVQSRWPLRRSWRKESQMFVGFLMLVTLISQSLVLD